VGPRAGEKVSSMPRRCTVSDHPESCSIDEALVSGAPYRSVAKRFGLSDSAVYRHKSEHLPAHLLKAREVEEVAHADDLLEQVRLLQAHALYRAQRWRASSVWSPPTSWIVRSRRYSMKSLCRRYGMRLCET
jgi:hypothetical protein